LPTSTGLAYPGSHDLNYSNRPVRTRMPGGVGGDRSAKLTAPIPIVSSSSRQGEVSQSCYEFPLAPFIEASRLKGFDSTWWEAK
jgi:hypothetical protein